MESDTDLRARNYDERPCTCSPADNPPKPCPQKFALHECRQAAKKEIAIGGVWLRTDGDKLKVLVEIDGVWRVATMNKVTHTIGPFAIQYGAMAGDQHFTIASVSADPKARGIVCEYAVPAPRPWKEVQANARLFVMAPELLMYLRIASQYVECLQFHDRDCREGDGDEVCPACIDRWRMERVISMTEGGE